MFKTIPLRLKLTLYILTYMKCNTICYHTHDMTFNKNVIKLGMLFTT
jgi:hypothetical protein